MRIRTPAGTLPAEVKALDYDQYQSISYRADHALWADGRGRFRAKFFHLGMYFNVPVRMHELADGMAQELAYDPEMFDYGKSGLQAARMPRDLGFAGFRINFHSDWKHDVAAFLGASYFRAVGGERQYGLSARGLAIDSGGDEEFPTFTDVLARAAGARCVDAHRVRADGFAERRRRLSLRHPSGRAAGDGRGCGAVPAQGHRARSASRR